MDSGLAIAAVVLGGAILLGGLAALGVYSWSVDRLSCGELVGGGFLVLLFLSLCLTGWFPWNLFLFVIPLVYGLTAFRSRSSSNRLLREMRAQDYQRCERVIALDPKNAAAHALLGELLEKDNRITEAMEAYHESLRLDPSQGRIRYRCERLVENQGLKESRQVKCSGCMTIQPRESGICWKCGRVLDAPRALRTRLRRMDGRGRMAVLVMVSMSVITLVSLPLLADEYVRTWGLVLLLIGLTGGIASGVFVVKAYRIVLDDEWVGRDFDDGDL
ncbi:MAG: tetratricopeptide repeat protein [Armatimonadota bacterium]